MSKNKILPEGRTSPQKLRTKNEQEEFPLVRFTILGIHRQLSTVIKKKTETFADNLSNFKRSKVCQTETHDSKRIGFEGQSIVYPFDFAKCQMQDSSR